MLYKIADFIEFNPNRQGLAAVIEEFNHKYANSWLLLNGTPHLIHQIKQNGQKLIASPMGELSKDYTDIKSIQNITPKTGLYANKERLVYLYRIPNRQWTKGFSTGNNYQYKSLAKDANVKGDVNIIKHLFDPTTRYHPESMIFDGKVFLHWQKIGYTDNNSGKIHVNNNRFIKELEELWPQYRITLDAHNPPKDMDARLITDF